MFSQLLYGNGGNTNHPHHNNSNNNANNSPSQHSPQPYVPTDTTSATPSTLPTTTPIVPTPMLGLESTQQLLSQALSLQEQQQHVMNLMIQSYATIAAQQSLHHPHSIPAAALSPYHHHSNDGSPVNLLSANNTHHISKHMGNYPAMTTNNVTSALSPSSSSIENHTVASHTNKKKDCAQSTVPTTSNSSGISVLSDEEVEFLSQPNAPDYNDGTHAPQQQYNQATNHQRSPMVSTPGIVHQQYNFDSIPTSTGFLSVIQEKQKALQQMEELKEKQTQKSSEAKVSSNNSNRTISPEASSQSSYGSSDSPQPPNSPQQSSSNASLEASQPPLQISEDSQPPQAEESSKIPANRKRSRAQVESDQIELERLLTIPEKERTEQQKKTILKLRNRQTAKRSRDRKKLEFEATVEENKKLIQSNKQLTDQVKKLKSENEELKKTIEMLTKGSHHHHAAALSAALHHHPTTYLTPNGAANGSHQNNVDSPDSFTLTVSDDAHPHSVHQHVHPAHQPHPHHYSSHYHQHGHHTHVHPPHHHEDDIEGMINSEFDYMGHADSIMGGQPKTFQAFSPLFNFQNESSVAHPNKKSKMFMLVFFVACVCCFFIGTTLVNELPSHAVLMGTTNKSSPKRHKEVRLLNTHLYKHTYIPQNPSMPTTSLNDVIKTLATSQQEQPQQNESDVQSATKDVTSKTVPPTIEVVEEVVEQVMEEIVDGEEDNVEDNVNNMLDIDVMVNPDLSKWAHDQMPNLVSSSVETVPVMVKFGINKSPAYIVTSMDKNLSEEQQKQFISKLKTSVFMDMHGMCQRPLKLIQ